MAAHSQALLAAASGPGVFQVARYFSSNRTLSTSAAERTFVTKISPAGLAVFGKYLQLRLVIPVSGTAPISYEELYAGIPTGDNSKPWGFNADYPIPQIKFNGATAFSTLNESSLTDYAALTTTSGSGLSICGRLTLGSPMTVIPATQSYQGPNQVDSTYFKTFWKATSRTFTVTIASPGVFTSSAHGLIVGSVLVFSTTGALPTGLTAGMTYYVVSVPTTSTFTVSATLGGSAINTTGSQSGTHTLSIREASSAVKSGGYTGIDSTVWGFSSIYVAP